MPYSNALLNSLFNNSNQFFFIIDDNLTIISCNDKMKLTLGFDNNTPNCSLSTILEPVAYNQVVVNITNKLLSFNLAAYLFSAEPKRKIMVDLGASFAEDKEQGFAGYVFRARDISNENKTVETITHQNNKLNEIFESGTQHVFTFNTQHVITHFNKNIHADILLHFNYDLQEGVSNLKTWLNVIANDDYEYIIEKVCLVFLGTPQQFDMSFKINDNIVWREVFLYPIKNNQNSIAEVVGISHNITERKRAEKQLKLQESKLSALLDSGTHHIYSIAKNALIHAFNTNFQEFCRRFFNIELEDHNISIYSIYNSNETKLREHVRLAFKGIPQFFEMSVRQKTGEVKYYEMYFTPIVEAEPDIEEVSVLAINITENHNNNIKLFNQGAKLNTVIETSSLVFFTISNELSLTSFNSRFEEMYVKFFNEKPFVGLSQTSFITNYSTEPKERLKQFVNFWLTNFGEVFKGKSNSFEHELVSPTGEIFWFDIILAPIFDSNNKVTEISVIGQLANERKQAELKLLQSLQEKEVLLKEVHHRVKNNLQVISSLLNLQSDFVEDKKALKILRESQNRVKSMSYIHEILYQTNEFGKIPFENYLKSILYNLVDSYSKVGVNISVEVKFEDVSVDLDTSIPCGLIVNELISNSLKYAFEGQNDGSILMTCKTVNNKIELSIKDNGKGFPENFDVETSKSLGMQLVYALVEQIDGTISIINNFGTEFLITFAPRKQH